MKVEEYLKKNKKLSKNYFYNLLKRTMLTISLVLVVMIISKNSENFRNMVNKYTFNSNYNFSKINQLYKKYLLSLKKTKELISPVNGSSILEYTKSEKYNDGVILEVGENYNVKMIESGLVVYVGEKETFYYKKGEAVSGDYLNKISDDKILANSTGTYHEQTYKSYSKIQENAEPLYWKSNDTTLGSGTDLVDYYILTVSWAKRPAGQQEDKTNDKYKYIDDIEDKETDIVYISVSAIGEGN